MTAQSTKEEQPKNFRFTNRLCECGRPATERTTTGQCCARCAKLQKEYEESQRQMRMRHQT